MAEAYKPRPPSFTLSGNISENWKNFEERFDDFAITCNFRDCEKDAQTEKEEHYIAAKRQKEISQFRLCLPDDTLSVLRHTITPQVPEADRKKPWVWMERLRIYYTGAASSKLTHRFTFSHMGQKPNESVMIWESRVRQSSSLCQYKSMTDELARDRFIFGLRSEAIRTELLKSDVNADKSEKTMGDVTHVARAMETADSANTLIVQATTHREQVNYNATSTQRAPTQIKGKRLPHAQLKLKREQGTCWYCGTKPSHPWKECRSRGKSCSKCGYMDHFQSVCLMSPGQTQPSKPFKPQKVHQLSTDENESQYFDDGEYEQTFTLTLSGKARKFLTNIMVSSTGEDFKPLTFQVDTGSSCNTISEKMLNQLSPKPFMIPSTQKLHPYGDTTPIIPIGQVDLVVDQTGKYELLRFQVLSDDNMASKPALLCGSDSEKLGLLTVNCKVYAVTSVGEEESGLEDMTDQQAPRAIGKLTKDHVLKQYSEQFKGKGYMGPPVHFKLRPDVTPVQMPIHRVPLSKRQNEFDTIQNYAFKAVLKHSVGFLCTVIYATNRCGSTNVSTAIRN